MDSHKKEYTATREEISQKMRKLPSLEEVAELQPYAERLKISNIYFIYTLIRDGYVSDYVKRGLSNAELSEVKNILKEFIDKEDPEILTLEEKLKPKRLK